MGKRKVWANILCNEDMTPFKMIVTNGQSTSVIPVKNTSIKTLKRQAKEIFGASEVLVSKLFDHDTKTS